MISLSKNPGGCLLHIDMFLYTYRTFFLLFIILLINSCNKQENPDVAPAIQLIADSGYIGNSTSVSPGTLMNFKLDFKEGSEKLTNFYIEVTDLNHLSKRYFDTAMYVSNLLWTGSFYKSPDSFESWDFIIRDRQGGSSSVLIQILADTNAVYLPLLLLEGVEMGAQNNVENGSFFSFNSQLVYFPPEAKQNQEIIDLVYYYGEDEWTIASPGANIEDGVFSENVSPVNWEIRNTTRFIKTGLTQADFNNAQNDSILIANYVDADGKRKAKNLTSGDIYVFKNQQNRLGMFKVNSVSGTDAGCLEIDLKIQSEQK
ncbi:MAG: hypothetical protein K8R86_06105 [Bacteroidales bacterium]|nr:hypothetical protein [Bacteroidales bacterium]